MQGPSDEFSGQIFSAALPVEDPVLYGTATLSPKGAFEARSLQTFKITYQAGRFGLDDTGAIRIVFRFTADGGAMQTEDPLALNYVTARSSNGVPLKVSFNANGHQRPWYQALTIMVSHGYLREGDTIEIVLGDTSGGSAGLQLQSMCETAFAWRVLADICATGHFVPIAESPSISIVPSVAKVWKAVLPSHRRPGEVFRFSLKAEDEYGNPSDQVEASLILRPTCTISGLPQEITFEKGMRSVVLDGLTCDESEFVAIDVLTKNGETLVRSNPMIIRRGEVTSFWGDMHGQSGESVGINTAREYFTFARDLAFLDSTSHQANDFHINAAFWAHINELTAEFHEDGRFLTLPGYEWSGNTGVGGDRNVYFRHEGCTIRRSSHALIEDRKEIETDATTARDLFDALQDVDCLLYAHIGGRPADVAYAHDPRIETAMEIHSAWGTFEWLMEDCFNLGYRVGVVANSDGHKGRPGASYPGASQFGAYGGLTCFLMNDLTRDDHFDCLRKRRHYATSGDRIHVELSVSSNSGFKRFDIDPAISEGKTEQTDTLRMGDIATTDCDQVSLTFCTQALAPIERVEVMNAMGIISTIRNPATFKKGSRIRVLWRGAMVKGRGARADWEGSVAFKGCAIKRTKEINAWNPDHRLQQENNNTLSWKSVTAGNFGAIDIWLDESEDSTMVLETNHVNARVKLSDIGECDHVLKAGGLDLEVRIFRLPDELEHGPLAGEVPLSLNTKGDNPLWVRVTTEDGFQAWTSPVYLTQPQN